VPISVAEIHQDVRKEGLGCGVPMTFIKLGPGTDYDKSTDLLEQVFLKLKSKWLCIYGPDTLQAGMGALLKGLRSLDAMTELECKGSELTPGWLHSVDRWIVDYEQDNQFNFLALRSTDMVRFYFRAIGDTGFIDKGLKVLDTPKQLFAGTKCILVSPKVFKQFKDVILDLANSSQRTRIFIV
jgi:hypothetical protein